MSNREESVSTCALVFGVYLVLFLTVGSIVGVVFTLQSRIPWEYGIVFGALLTIVGTMPCYLLFFQRDRAGGNMAFPVTIG